MVVTVALMPLTVEASATSRVAHSGSVTRSEHLVREFLDDGAETIADSRSFSVTVDQTQDLRGRQEIDVSWSGAHPTSGIVADENSIDAQQEEYPVVLLECRGIARNATVPADRITPETCWTQNWSERYQDTFSTQFPPYRLDQFGTTADAAQVVGAPPVLPKACDYLPAPTQHWVPFVAADGEVYYGGPAGCAGQPPEAENVGNSALPSNETFGVTGLNGTGSANFDVFTSAENASLGCSTTVACSLVVVPIEGISCGVTGVDATDAATCEETGAYAPGELVDPVGQEDLTVSGSLWWSASNWRNAITIPLSFAVPADVCALSGNPNVLQIYGSELLIQATTQWAPHFCLTKGSFTFVHVQTGEPEARTILASGSTSAAFTSESPPGGYERPVMNAPTAVTGFSISYVIDGANGQPYTHLRLTPLLLAKLLTESYPSELPIQQEDPALSHNPLNITLDPEFIALNPGITQGVVASEAASELMTVLGGSDVMYALTSYINANPQARAWLNGKPDPWGMVVNPAYKGIKLPLSQWPLLSTFEPTSYYNSDVNDCLYHNPQPFLPLVAAPLLSLEDVSESLQYGIANSTTVCSQIDGTSLGEKLVAQGPQTIGYRFLIGVTPVADNYRNLVRSAALESAPGVFVQPTPATMDAAARLMRPDAATGTWSLPYPDLRRTADEHAYPGTMIVNTAAPTSGLSAQSAADLSSFLRFVITEGQHPGLGVGQLPPGYVPITSANGLGAMADYTLATAEVVGNQDGQVIAVTSPNALDLVHHPSTTPTTTPATTPVTTPVTTPTTPPTTPTTISYASGPPAGATPMISVGGTGRGVGFAVVAGVLVAGFGETGRVIVRRRARR